MIYRLVSLAALMMIIFIWSLFGSILLKTSYSKKKILETMKNKFTLMILMATLAINTEAASGTCDILFAHNRVNISILDKAELLAALYILIIFLGSGRVMKIDISADVMSYNSGN
ncbi:hypothetical protein [Endozoicomonas sp. 8E]|uniref:hypothetical protein n=1 Tax=Endozoicomonas sp. 8E TaxID=3035692 RepID=UPI0029390F1A|nr:hypothetical protein [Endozoicomonas sp. 8E]WOG28565.1 hypothetical protein P6910_02610 [Endozoicomonas sp. 8E]